MNVADHILLLLLREPEGGKDEGKSRKRLVTLRETGKAGGGKRKI